MRAKPVFADIDPDNWCLDPKSVEKNINEKTKAIIVVDLFGNMPYMDELKEISKRYGVPIIEDAAEALGSLYKGIRAGKFGVGSVFSFHRTKTMTTGEGGMLLTDDDYIYDRCSLLRDHGRDPNQMYVNTEAAYKYMPFNLQAALGYAQFKRIDELVSKKREQFRLYQDQLKDLSDIQLNSEPEEVHNSVWITTLVVGKSYHINKDELMKKLAELGTPSRPFFYPLSSLPAYEHLGEPKTKENSHSFDISARGINLPGAANIGEEEIIKITNDIKEILCNITKTTGHSDC